MAGIFQQTIESQGGIVQSVQRPSAAGALFDLGGVITQGLGQARDRAVKAAKDAQPTYTERKDMQENKLLNDYQSELINLENTWQDQNMTPLMYAQRQREIGLKYANAGLDLSTSRVGAIREAVTGKPDEQFGLTEDQVLVNKLTASPDGQAQLSLAASRVKDKGGDPQDLAQVTNEVRSMDASKQALDNLKVQGQLDFEQNKGLLLGAVDNFANDTRIAVDTLRNNGVFITSGMIQNQYSQFLTLKAQLTSALSNSSITSEQRLEVDKKLSSVEDFFVQAGMNRVDGVIKLSSQEEQQLSDKAHLFVKALTQSGELDKIVVAQGIINKGYSLSAQDWAALNVNMDVINTTGLSLQPDWVNEADVLVANDLIGSYTNVVNYLNAPSTQTQQQFDKVKDGARSMLGEEEAAKWAGMTNEQGWAALSTYGTITKGFSVDAISADPELRKGFFQNVFGLALSFESVNVNEEAISFNGLRGKVSAELPALIERAKALDPTQGAAAQAMLFRSLVGQRFAYDQRVKQDESKLGIVFNPTTKTYNLDQASSDNFAVATSVLVNGEYGGDVLAGIQDGFSRITPEAFATKYRDQMQKIFGSEVDLISVAATISGGIKQNLPSERLIRDVLDMRNSSVYLDGIAKQIMPDAAKNAAEDAKSAPLAPFNGSGIDLLRKFEGFSATPYWDVNHLRAGYGSDTITKEDGTVVKVTRGAVVTRADAERDLARRYQEFQAGAINKIGQDSWNTFDENTKAALTSVAYNYGSIPDRILKAARSGDREALAQAVEGLAGDNNGINKDRRMQEAAIIRGNGAISANISPQAAADQQQPRPQARPISVGPTPVVETTAPAAPAVDVAPVGDVAPARPAPEQAAPQAQQAPAAPTTASLTNPGVPPQILAALQKLVDSGNDLGGAVVINSDLELKDAIASGKVKSGDWIVFNGEVKQVQ